MDDKNPDGNPRVGKNPPAPDPQPASRVPDHELLRRIGKGAFGEVWLARNVTGHYRAVKVVSRTTFASDVAFNREFYGIQKFEPISREHQGFVDILHVGRNEEQDFYYYVMELADDQFTGREIDPAKFVPKTLATEKSNRTRLPLDECLKIGLSLSEALDHLHRVALIHRDIKPANIIFAHGVAKLADIGLVTDIGRDSIQGTPGFIPPEGTGKPRADLYALGRVLYEISTGKGTEDFPELPTQLGPLKVDERWLQLNQVILKACKNDPERRYQTAREMHDAMLAIERGEPLPCESWTERMGRIEIGWGTFAKVMGGIILAVLVVMGVRSNRPAQIQSSIPSVPPAIQPFAPAGTTELLQDDFTASEMNTALWTSNQFGNVLHENAGRRECMVEQTNGMLRIEGRSEHERGWTCTQDAWVESVMDFKGKGDVRIEINLDGEAHNGAISIKMSDGRFPIERNDPKAVTLYSARGGNFDPLRLPARRIRIEIAGSSGIATVSTDADPELRAVNLSELASWYLRFYTTCDTSAGFRPAYARLRLKEIRASKIPAGTGIVGLVFDETSGRPVAGAVIKGTNGTKLAESGLDGSFSTSLPPGPLQVFAQASDYKDGQPVKLELSDGSRRALLFSLRKLRFRFGDVVSTISYGTNRVIGIAANSNGVYYVTTDDAGTSLIFRNSFDDMERVKVAEGSGLCSIAFCGDSLFGVSMWPGVIYQFTTNGQIEYKTLRGEQPEETINWPGDIAFDGTRLWFVENTSIENRYNLYAMELVSKKIVARLPTQDKQICGVAWDGERLWISSGSGRVYEVNINIAIHKGSVEEGTGREFSGHYSRLTFADGHLWGLDMETRRICKIRVQ